jgi:hypothetical protein
VRKTRVTKAMYFIFLATLVVALPSVITAQDTKTLPPQHLREAGASMKLRAAAPHNVKPPTLPFFCPMKTCLLYSGDNDTTSSDANGLFDFENPGIGITDAEVWVNYKTGKDTKGYIVTGLAGNYYTTATTIGTNPTPVQLRVGISAGNGGKQICKGTTGGNAVVAAYGTPDFGLNSMNYWIKKLNKPCTETDHEEVFWLIVPQYNDGSTIGYLEDNDGAKANKFAKPGFAEKQDDSYFNSASFGVNFEPTWGSSGACGGIGCDGFSWALNGKSK